MVNITIREYLTDETDMENLLLEDEVLLNEQGIVPKRDDVRLSVREVLAFSRGIRRTLCTVSSNRWRTLCGVRTSWSISVLQGRR